LSRDDLDRTIARLSAEYAAQLPGTIARMEELWCRVIAAENAQVESRELVRMAHSVAGSGTTFGLADASRAAREFEILLDRLNESGRPPNTDERETGSALLAALRLAAVQS
jgi:HPt (histidine-containing phosphotransfer) domain-containing protein